MQSEEIEMSLKVLREHGWSIAALAREFGLNWRTVKREVEAEGPRRYGPRPQSFALTASQLAHIQRRFVVCPGIRGTDLHAELRHDFGYEGGYQTFQRQLRHLRPALVRDPEIRFETGPGIQTQADWAHLGPWRLGDQMVELYAMVAILGCSRAPAFRFATDMTRPTSFRCLVRCLEDLGGVTHEILTDRDPAFCIGATSDGAAILAPEWVELCELLGTVPRACRPYRAKTKGKVERMVRELKESFLPWLSGQLLPARPTLDFYDLVARRWIESHVLPRRHRTTDRIVGEAWDEERPRIERIPARILANVTAGELNLPARGIRPEVVDLDQYAIGEQVEIRSMTAYEVAE
jgi:transposase